MPVHVDVVVDVDPIDLPYGRFIPIRRQWLEGRPVQPLEQLPAGCAKLLHRPLVQFHHQLGDGRVQRPQTEEGPRAGALFRFINMFPVCGTLSTKQDREMPKWPRPK